VLLYLGWFTTFYPLWYCPFIIRWQKLGANDFSNERYNHGVHAGGDILCHYLLGNGKVNLIGNIIEQQFLLTYDWGFGAALSLVLMIMILISMAVMQRSDEDMEGGAGLW